MDYHLMPDIVMSFGQSGGESGLELGAMARHRPQRYVEPGCARRSTHRGFQCPGLGGRIEAGFRYGVWLGVGVTPYAVAQIEAFHPPFYRESDVTGSGFG
jgi:hypothetical protein